MHPVPKRLAEIVALPHRNSDKKKADFLFYAVIACAACWNRPRQIIGCVILVFLLVFKWPCSAPGAKFWSFKGFCDSLGTVAASCVLALVFLGLGVVMGHIPYASVDRVFSRRVESYFFWALFQQLLCMRYIVQAQLNAYGDKQKAAKETGWKFALVHLPNPFLMVLTGFGGYILALTWYRYRNVYAVALCHAIVATAGLISLPDVIHAHYRIGGSFVVFWLRQLGFIA